MSHAPSSRYERASLLRYAMLMRPENFLHQLLFLVEHSHHPLQKLR
jgi:hypothetical protein